MTTKSLYINIDKWIKENEASFLPPVCNKLMYFHQLNVMLVGGPNTRKDFHIEEGEEGCLFDSNFKTVSSQYNQKCHRMSADSTYSPAGCFFKPRYYVDNSTDILFERWFYCENLGTQLVPVIQEFMASKQHKTGKPDPVATGLTAIYMKVRLNKYCKAYKEVSQLFVLSIGFTYMNSALDPVIYCCSSSVFRNAVKRMINQIGPLELQLSHRASTATGSDS
ncbi:3-hydroxyanthranilate 3,4-dioxygenase [Bagarius yarrelli]|uniref:3-hydroxyanthranilate 3,4-dioxygenase n=1 Tax=Bagarius yarrelli TaxID=175774 RepID=A0A556TR88_BAGYA|nr:3-hydroxyanthranilate 3,4-dioxygenase [Bagarius yarrelli]